MIHKEYSIEKMPKNFKTSYTDTNELSNYSFQSLQSHKMLQKSMKLSNNKSITSYTCNNKYVSSNPMIECNNGIWFDEEDPDYIDYNITKCSHIYIDSAMGRY